MDANGTKFHLLLGKSDWGRATPGAREWARLIGPGLQESPPVLRELAPLAELWKRSDEDSELTGLRWDPENNELTLAPQLFQFNSSPKDQLPRPTGRRGAGRDRFGNWYWISEDEKEILVNSSGSGGTAHFWSSAADCGGCESTPRFGAFRPLESPAVALELRLRGLAVTEDHYLVVGVLEPAGLLIFDLHAGADPVQLIWPEEIKFTPFDFASRPGGGVFILDRDPSDPTKGTRYWALDRHFNPQSRNQSEVDLNAGLVDSFQPLTGQARALRPRLFPAGITLDSASPVAALDAIAIEALPDQTVLILDLDDGSGFSKIYRYGFEGEIGEAVSTAVLKSLVAETDRPTFKFIAHDFAFVGEHESNGRTIPDRLYVVEKKGNQSIAFNVSLHDGQLKLEPLQAYLPMRLFGGKGLVAAGDQAWYDFSDRWIPLVEQPRPRYEVEATLETPVFDSGELDCKWHRLMIDARIAPESQVDVWTRSANDAEDLTFREWYREPSLYRRRDGSEIPYSPIKGPVKSFADYGTWELLFQRARGRFLQIKLRLSGNGRTTPRLRALRAYYPRFSYLEHYLPAVYREDVQSASFLDRFLANFEGFYTAIEDRIAAVQALFDVDSVPGEYLDWLGGWFGVVLDPTWSDLKRRLFIHHAMDFFQYRGTIHGIKTALRLAMEDCADESVFDLARSSDHRSDSIRIIEDYRVRQTPGSILGDPTSVEASLPGLPQVASASRWRPSNGKSDLYSRFSSFLKQRFEADLPPLMQFSLRNFDWQMPRPDPNGSGSLTVFKDSNDDLLWRAFLKSRYPTIEALNLAHETNLSDFDMAAVPPTVLPASTRLSDWNSFVAAKSAAWRDFAQQSLGYVPRSLGSERARWRDFLAGRYSSIGALNADEHTSYARFEDVPLPTDEPEDGAPAKAWNDFQRATAGTPAEVMRTRWRDFLARRYRRIRALNDTWDTSWSGFDAISLFDELPLREGAIADWNQFESVVLAIEASAHRFTVLLPTPANRSPDEFDRRRELALRIANWEKPAHTVFEVKFYWSMFQVGAARLGYDTLLDTGSRVPQLITPLVLGKGYLAEGYASDVRDLGDRIVVGRKGIGQRCLN